MGNSPAQNPTSPNRGYPLPVAGNFLADDVVRIGQAISQIDGDVAAASTKLLLIRSIASSYAVKAADLACMVDYVGNSASDAITLPALAAVVSGFNLRLRNSSSAGITLKVADSAAINGQSTYALLASSTIAVVSDGTTWKVLSVAQVSAGSLTASGNAASPAHSFTADPTVGLYLAQNGQGALAASGVTSLIWTSAGILVGGAAGGFKGAGTLNATKVFYGGQDLIARADGNAASPTYSFGSEPSLGLYRAGLGMLGVSISGASQFVFSATGLLGAGATAPAATQIAGSANLTDLYLNGVSLASSVTFGPTGLALPGATGGVKGAGTLNAKDLLINGSSLGGLLGLGGSVGGTLNLTDVTLAGSSLAGAISFGTDGVSLAGVTGGHKGAGTLNVGALYIQGVVLNPGLITPTPANALSYLRINAAGGGVEYRTPTQLLGDLGVQTALGYVPVNRNGDTMLSLTVSGTFQVGAAANFGSTLTSVGVASLASLSVTGNASVAGAFVATGVTTLQAASATSFTINGSLGVSGATSVASLTASLGKFNGNLSVIGSTSLVGLSASTGSFTGALTTSSTLSVTGTATFVKLTASGPAVFMAGLSSSAGLTIASGNLTLGNNQQIVSQDSVNGFAFTGGALGTAGGSTNTLVQFTGSVGNGAQTFRVQQRRLAVGGSDWTTSATRLQLLSGPVPQGFLEWGVNANGVGALRLGAVDASGTDQFLLTLDPAAGASFTNNLSITAFLGVGGGAQLNGGVALTGGVQVDTLTGSGDIQTTGNMRCRYIQQTSDERLKRDFMSIDEGLARSFLLEADPISYRWLDATQVGRHYGYRAQKLEEIGMTDLVHAAPEQGLPDALSLDYTSTIALLHVALRRTTLTLDEAMTRLAILERAQPHT